MIYWSMANIPYLKRLSIGKWLCLQILPNLISLLSSSIFQVGCRAFSDGSFCVRFVAAKYIAYTCTRIVCCEEDHQTSEHGCRCNNRESCGTRLSISVFTGQSELKIMMYLRAESYVRTIIGLVKLVFVHFRSKMTLAQSSSLASGMSRFSSFSAGVSTGCIW